MQVLSSGSLSQVWLRAAVAGSIWATFEIILGSFLHNLRVPLSGTILAFIGVWILIAFQHFWKVKGLVWRAGLICAMMKSISPSAIILGPMIGIISEALLIELSVRALGRNLAAYIIGGGLAVLSTLAQKVVNLIILYGLDIVKILEALYRYAVKQIGMEHVSPVYLIIIISIIYLLAGATGALMGYLTGRKYSGADQSSNSTGSITLERENELLRNNENEKYSLFFLLMNILAITLILGLLNFNLLIPAAVASIAYVLFSLARYPHSMRRLKKPGFWISFVLITISAAFLWNWVAEGVFFTTDGLLVGLKMNARAAVLITGFASVSAELRNPVIRQVLYNRGFASLYQSLSLSFSSLPYLVSTLNPKSKKHGREGGGPLNTAFLQAMKLYKTFEEELEKRPVIFIITGEVNQGKTTFAGKVAGLLKEAGVKPGGFLSIATFKDGERAGFDLLNLSTGTSLNLCSKTAGEGKIQVGRFFFNPSAIKEGEEIIKKASEESDVLFIDEIGALELGGGGWSNAITAICSGNVSPQVWVVRKKLVKKVSRRWSAGEILLIDISSDSEKETARHIRNKIDLSGAGRLRGTNPGTP